MKNLFLICLVFCTYVNPQRLVTSLKDLVSSNDKSLFISDNSINATIPVSVFKKSKSNKIDIYNMVVSKDGSGDFTTLQEAINAAKGFPDKRVNYYR